MLHLGLSFDAKFRRIAAGKQANPGQKMILAVLALYPEGQTLYQIMNHLGCPRNRRTIQRRMEWLIDTKQVIASHQGAKGWHREAIVYKLGERLW